MILYIHAYHDISNEIVIKPMNVKETEKTFRTIERKDCFQGFTSRFNKNNIGKFQVEWNNDCYMVELYPDIKRFAVLIKEHKENEIAILEQRLVNAKKSLKEFETVDVVIKEVQKYDI